MKDDPRAEYCSGFDDNKNIKGLLTRGSPVVCTYCSGYCNCDYPTYQRFVVEVECYDEKIKPNALIRMLGDRFGKKYGEMDVKEEKGVHLTSDVGKRIGWVKEGL
jgi:hypothetical protein